MIDWDRLETANAKLNAFTNFDKTARFGNGQLDNLTLGVKANIAVKDMPWTGGMEYYRDRIAKQDADIVAKLRAEGAAVIGMLNMEEAALGAKTDNPFFGTTYNPHRMGYTPGGSSGGSAAAVAAGLCDIALGTDTMGSVRVPAAYCGIYGLKPSRGAASQDGLEMVEQSLDTIGPLARSLELLESTGRIFISFDLLQPIDNIVLLENLGDVDCAPSVLYSYDAATSELGAGASFSLPHPLTRVRYAGFIMSALALTDSLSEILESRPEQLSDHLKNLLKYGAKRSRDDLSEDRKILEETSEAMVAAVQKHGAILLPTTPQAAFSQADQAPANQADFTCLASIAGLPAITIPAGWTSEHLPVGVQLIGAHGNEAGLFELARKLDQKLGAYRPPEFFLNRNRGEE